MKLYKIKLIIDITSYISIVFSYCIMFSSYGILIISNTKWLYGLPIFLILAASPIFSIVTADKCDWQDPWDYDDREVKRKQVLTENKRLKKALDIQNKLKYARVL